MAKKTISVQDVETTEAPVETTEENNGGGGGTAEETPVETTEENTEEPKKETTEEPKEEEPEEPAPFDPGESENPKEPEIPSETPATDITELKKQGFITHVITPEKLTKENLAFYVTQVGKASELYKDLEKNSSEKK